MLTQPTGMGLGAVVNRGRNDDVLWNLAAIIGASRDAAIRRYGFDAIRRQATMPRMASADDAGIGGEGGIMKAGRKLVPVWSRPRA